MTMTDPQTDYPGKADPAEGMAPWAVFDMNGPSGRRTIKQAIQAALDALADESIKRLSPNETPPFARSRAVLGALTLCYALQIYPSADVAGVVARDPSLPDFRGDDLPDARVLSRFREENRVALHSCLTAALVFLVEQKISLGLVTKVNHPQIAEEASRRIVTAMFADSAELGGEPPRAEDQRA